MQATHPAITGLSFQQVPQPSSMEPVGTTRRILVPQCGMGGLTPTVWELDSPTPPDSGWSFGFGYGYGYYPWYYPWWGPMGYYGYGWYPYYGWGAWGGAAVANVYGVWGNTAYSRTGAAWANPYTGNYGAATRGAYHNTQTGRTTVAGRGTNTNIYTGNTAGYRGGATYNPNTGIVAGGGAGYAGNIYTGQGTAGRGGFAYNTNTNTGIAAGKNNVYAGKDGTVYKYNRNSGSWSSNSGSGWQITTRPDANLQRQQQMRTQGAQRTQNFNSARSYGGENGRRENGRGRTKEIASEPRGSLGGLFYGGVSFNPGKKQLVTNRQDDRTDEQANDAHGDKSANCAEKNNDHRDGDATPKQQRLQNVVDQSHKNAPNQENHGLGRTRTAKA